MAWKEIDGRFVALELQRNPISKTDKQLEQWKDNTQCWIESIDPLNIYLKSTSSYACNMCSFRDLCIHSYRDKIDESVLEMFYEKCDPFAYLEAK